MVLWNCDGKKRFLKSKATVPERNDVFRSTYDSWKQKNEIPTVVLAQELYLGGLTTTWRELSKKSNSFNKCEAACFFLMGLGQEIKFLDSGDLQGIMDSTSRSKNKYDGGIARIHCGIVTLGAEKILICSWHGQHNWLTDNKKKDLLRKMLIFVDKVKKDKGCAAALVGCDFNLDIDKVFKSNILQSVQGADLYGVNTSDIIDYIIAWPNNRFIMRECSKIDTHHTEEVNPDPRMFDHPLIRYDFIVILKGKWEGEGKVKWSGECGEGEVTLTGDYRYVKVSGEWSGEWKGQDTLEIKRGDPSLSVDYGEVTRTLADGETFGLILETGEEMNWRGNGQVKWEGEDTEVTWNGTGSVEWRGKGKATWVGGKLEKWEGSRRQTVRCADDRPVRWDGDGEVELQGVEFKTSHQGTWASEEFGVDRVRYSLTESCELGWSGRGVVWKVTGKGAGTMSDCDTV